MQGKNRMRAWRAKQPKTLWLIPTPPIRDALTRYTQETGKTMEDIGQLIDHQSIYKTLGRPHMTILTADKILTAIDRNDLWHRDPQLRALYTGEAA